jgi:hypothetical protein
MAITDNLISYWKLDEASGNATDAHGSNTLNDTNTVGAGTGKINGARDFEADNTEFFTIADNADLSTGDIDFTIQAWVNAESFGANRVIIGKWGGGSQREYMLIYFTSTQRFGFQASNDGSASTTVSANNLGTPSTGTWYHIVCWHDSVNDQIGIAVNNGTPNTAAHSTGVRDGTAPFRIGDRSESSLPWDGLILSSQDRTDLYNAGNGLAYPFTTGAAVPRIQHTYRLRRAR